MSALITLAKECGSQRIIHINEVDKSQLKSFSCFGCRLGLIRMKSQARKKDWHFRHTVESTCEGNRDTALHDYAVQILMDHSEIILSKTLSISYTEPKKEASVLGKRSDVVVRYQEQDVHFEVFVTHDLDQNKIEIYRSNKTKCVKIDLSSKELLNAEPETIKNEVLKVAKNKIIVYWQDVPQAIASAQPSTFLSDLLFAILVFLGLRFLYKKLYAFFRPHR